jgi:hypothetical protein
MRVAGVRCDDGRVVWADVGDRQIQPLDRVVVAVDGAEWHGHVFVSPERLLQPPEDIAGIIVRVESPSDQDLSCADLPGSEMPPLGSTITIDGRSGAVTQIDPVRRTVTVTTDDGAHIEREVTALPSSLVEE